jgi:hypothetical protein
MPRGPLSWPSAEPVLPNWSSRLPAASYRLTWSPGPAALMPVAVTTIPYGLPARCDLEIGLPDVSRRSKSF